MSGNYKIVINAGHQNKVIQMGQPSGDPFHAGNKILKFFQDVRQDMDDDSFSQYLDTYRQKLDNIIMYRSVSVRADLAGQLLDIDPRSGVKVLRDIHRLTSDEPVRMIRGTDLAGFTYCYTIDLDYKYLSVDDDSDLIMGRYSLLNLPQQFVFPRPGEIYLDSNGQKHLVYEWDHSKLYHPQYYFHTRCTDGKEYFSCIDGGAYVFSHGPDTSMVVSTRLETLVKPVNDDDRIALLIQHGFPLQQARQSIPDYTWNYCRP